MIGSESARCGMRGLEDAGYRVESVWPRDSTVEDVRTRV